MTKSLPGGRPPSPPAHGHGVCRAPSSAIGVKISCVDPDLPRILSAGRSVIIDGLCLDPTPAADVVDFADLRSDRERHLSSPRAHARDMRAGPQIRRRDRPGIRTSGEIPARHCRPRQWRHAAAGLLPRWRLDARGLGHHDAVPVDLSRRRPRYCRSTTGWPRSIRRRPRLKMLCGFVWAHEHLLLPIGWCAPGRVAVRPGDSAGGNLSARGVSGGAPRPRG